MLGIKLGQVDEARLARFVRRSGQRKSDVGRAAIAEYLDRHDDDDELERHVALIAELECANPVRMKELDDSDRAAWATINRLD